MKNQRRIASTLIATLIISSVALSGIPSTFAAVATPQAKSKAGGSCDQSTSTCSGFDIGSPGTHISNGQGSGDLAGWEMVRFDAFQPKPELVECKDPDTKLFASIGASTTKKQTYYEHVRVAVLRSDPTTIIAGLEDGPNWLSDTDYNLEDGTTRTPSQKIDEGPSKKPYDPWIGPQWLNEREYCLPLAGGGPVNAILQLKDPVVTMTPKNKAVIGMKNSKIKINLSQEVVQGAISIGFTLDSIAVMGCRPVDPKDVDSDCKDGTFFYAAQKNAPIQVTKMKFDVADATATYDIKFRRKGTYKLVAVGIFDGLVSVNGATGVSITEGNGLTSGSEPQLVTVRSVKSVGRKR